MPIYEYECSACQHTVEVLQKMSDPVLTKCPECDQNTLSKKVSAPAFQLKGTGWYATDFKDKKSSDPKTDAKPTTQEEKSPAAASSTTKKETVKSSDSEN